MGTYLLLKILEMVIMYLGIFPFVLLGQIFMAYRDRKQGKTVKWSRFFLVQLYCAVLTAILALTGIPSVYSISKYFNGFSWNEVNLIPFLWIKDDIGMYIENTMLFVPLGFLLPFFGNKYNRFSNTVVFGAIFSLTIELLQLFNIRVTDIDDFFMNTLGTAFGYILFKGSSLLWLKVSRKFNNNLPTEKKDTVGDRREPLVYMAVVLLAAFIIAPIITEPIETWIWSNIDIR